MCSTTKNNCRLAFVIPAFKGKYLAETLESLDKQSNKNFRVYIGDDASPDNLKKIIDPYQKRLTIYYVRFNDNLGGYSLVKQWERCIALSTEKFFCLFADDDILHHNCVDDFYSALKESNEEYDVYRFNNAVINESGKLIAYSTTPLRSESNLTFLYERMRNSRISYISSYIISRDAYRRENGIVDFPLAWFSDDASIILFSRLSGIYNIPGHPVYWRISSNNISAPNKDTYLKKIFAVTKYMSWIANQFRHSNIGSHSWGSKEFKTFVEQWFFRQLDCAGCYPIKTQRLFSISNSISPYCLSNKVTLFFKLYCHIRNKNRSRR